MVLRQLTCAELSKDKSGYRANRWTHPSTHQQRGRGTVWIPSSTWGSTSQQTSPGPWTPLTWWRKHSKGCSYWESSGGAGLPSQILAKLHRCTAESNICLSMTVWCSSWTAREGKDPMRVTKNCPEGNRRSGPRPRDRLCWPAEQQFVPLPSGHKHKYT